MRRRTPGMPCARLPLPVAVVAAGVLVAGALAGCQSEAAPPATGGGTSSAPVTSSTPTPTSTPSPSASPTSDIPPAARQKTEKGAEAFVRYFFDQVNLAWTTPDAALIDEQSDTGCKSCASLQATASDLMKRDRRYEKAPVSLAEVRAVPGAPRQQQFVEVQLVQHSVDIVDRWGKVVGSDDRAQFARTVAAVWKDGRWLVYDIA